MTTGSRGPYGGAPTGSAAAVEPGRRVIRLGGMRTSIRTAGVLAALLALGATGCAGGRTTQDFPPPPADLTSTDPAGPDLAGTDSVSTDLVGTDLVNNVRLVAYADCDEMTEGLRRAAARTVTPWGFGDAMFYAARSDVATAKQAMPEQQSHSTTNTHEAGVDEPDLVKTDGDRVITVTGGVLRVVDAKTRKVTGTLRLVAQDQAGDQSWVQAGLLVHGDRALVLFEGAGSSPSERRPRPGSPPAARGTCSWTCPASRASSAR
ncbi:hypothetical protein GCM10027612_21280 [Microbispora bryophytorum subsp. camponoti]